MQRARYIRTSTLNQNEARQLAKQHEGEVLFIDKVSGTVPFNKREQASKLLEEINHGHIKFLSVSSIDRLGRGTLNIIETLELLTERGVTLRVDNLGLESLINGKENPTFKLIVSVLANIAEMERTTLRERQLEGIEQAKKRGVYKGRVKGSTDSKEVILERYKEVVRHLRMNKPLRDIASRCNVSLGTVQKVKMLSQSNE
ncbi:MAG: recombinase family protein [Chitinophagia bacterium]|nr:recombinase family protein [Chitinophagia bacterium]